MHYRKRCRRDEREGQNLAYFDRLGHPPQGVGFRVIWIYSIVLSAEILGRKPFACFQPKGIAEGGQIDNGACTCI